MTENVLNFDGFGAPIDSRHGIEWVRTREGA